MNIAWQDWSEELLAVAREERRPVLVSIVASWCRFCREMDATTWSDPRVAALVAELAIAVRVDKDLRPDVDARYGQGGWPSTVILDPDGEVMAGGTWMPTEELLAQLAEAARRLRTEGPSYRAPPPPPAPRGGRLDASILPALEASLLAQFDSRHGGFGTGQKFPHPEALDYAILRHADSAAPRLREVVEKTLVHMAEGALHDAVEGGFFRFCAGRDWSRPHTEKLLETNAGLARNYLEAGQVLRRADLLEVGARTADALLALFRDEPSGLFHGSLDADDEYYARDADGRRTRRPPRRDGRFLADANARAIAALLKAGAVLDRPDLTRAAVASGAALLERLHRPGRGMYHYDDGQGRRLPGLLRDQAETARALLLLLQYADRRELLATLEELLERIATRHVGPDGDLVNEDEVAGARPARRADAAILDAASAAEVLLRGALVCGRPEWTAVARSALLRHAADHRRYGWAMAAYGRSVELLVQPPLHILVVGRDGDPRTGALLRAASSSYLPSRVVQHLDPEADAAALERLELPVRERPVAFVHLEHDCAAEHDEPETLWAVLAAANARRRLL